MDSSFMMVIVLVGFAGLMFWQTRKQKKQQDEVRDFRSSLKPGDEVMTQSGMVGEIVAVDTDAGYAIIKSDGSTSKWLIDAVTRNPRLAVPADEQDEIADNDATEIEDTKSATNDEFEVELEDEVEDGNLEKSDAK
ncbi:MAG: preprotein translocase subunit YajC [Bifidobacteriaceae bacterium]|jgi:preprotein translocase subunit YajC|nr:preprotein translocase subunit YajC [Bifidobacteriaceae bacterium]